MGESYLTPEQEVNLGNEFYNLHATFARPIRIFKTAKQTVILTNPDHSFIFDQAPSNDVMQTTIQSGTFGARILYGKKEPLNAFQSREYSDQTVIRLSDGEVRIKLDPTGAAFLAGADSITFDNTIFEVTTDKRPHGLFKPDFETFFLKKIQ